MRSKKQLTRKGILRRTELKDRPKEEGLTRSPIARGGPINKRSVKEQGRQREYAKQLEKDRETDQSCALCGSSKNLQRHHPAGRGNILNYFYVCAVCHEKIHAYPDQARKEGWLV